MIKKITLLLTAMILSCANMLWGQETIAPSSNANLASVFMDGYPWFEVTFAGEQTSFYKNVPSSTDFLCANPYPEDANATVSGDLGCKDLRVGENIFTFIVTAEDGITQKTYTVVVTRNMLIREEIINITTPGTLENYYEMFSPAWPSVTKLTITGNIDARDLFCLCNFDGYRYLTELDLSDANIVAFEGQVSGSSAYYPANELYFIGSATLGTWGANTRNLTSIILPKTLTSIAYGVLNHDGTPLTSLTIPEGVTKIGNFFAIYKHELTTLSLPSTLAEIGRESFLYLDSLSVVVNHNPNPIDISCVFTCGEAYAQTPTLYVPFGSGDAYRAAPIWQLFTIIELPDEGQDTVAITPTDKSALIEWMPYENAEGYRLMVYGDEAHTDTICMVEFDGAGVLKDIITYKAKSSMQAPSANPAYTVENLQSNTTYHYMLETIGLENVVLASKEGMFTTALEGTTGVDETLQDASSANVTGYYSLSGMRLPQEPQQGVYIIRYSNGKAEKVVKM